MISKSIQIPLVFLEYIPKRVFLNYNFQFFKMILIGFKK